MKYITTDKHPFLKDGIRFDYFNTKEIDIPYSSEGMNHITRIPDSNKMIIFWESNGYIKELQEPEFTKDDVKIMSCEFAIYIFRHCTDRDESYQKLYDNWLKQRNK